MQPRKVALLMNCYRNYPFTEALARIRRIGFEYVELTSSETANDPINVHRTKSELSEIQNAIALAGLKPLALSGHTDLFAEAAPDALIKKIQLADFMGCRYCNTFLGTPAPGREDAVLDTLSKVHPYLKKYDIHLGLELHGTFAIGSSLARLTRKLASTHIKINYDTANCIFYGNTNPEDDIPLCADEVGYLHIKEKAGKRDEWNFPALGDGYVNFESVFQALNSAGNPSPFSIEIEFTPTGPSSMEAVDQAARKSLRYIVEHEFHLYK